MVKLKNEGLVMQSHTHNARSHQLHWGEGEMERLYISCIK